MKTQELRIGNYVNHICNDELVTDIIADVGYHLLSSPKSITSRKDSDVVKELKPIPLTEEWSLKLGAVKSLYSNYIDFEYFEIYELKGLWYVEVDGVTLCELKYVHQLQNLYFALTGKELKIIK